MAHRVSDETDATRPRQPNPLAVNPSGHVPPVEEVLANWEPTILKYAASFAALYPACDSDHDEFAQAARIALWRTIERQGIDSAPYVRRVIFVAMHQVVRSARRGAILVQPVLDEYGEWDLGSAADMRERALDAADRLAIARWVNRQPHAHREVFRLLYVEGLSQREAAVAMRISQPRVAQLHRKMLAAGHDDLVAYAA